MKRSDRSDPTQRTTMSATQVKEEPFDSALAYAFRQKPIHLIELSMRNLSYAIRSVASAVLAFLWPAVTKTCSSLPLLTAHPAQSLNGGQSIATRPCARSGRRKPLRSLLERLSCDSRRNTYDTSSMSWPSLMRRGIRRPSLRSVWEIQSPRVSRRACRDAND